MKKTDGFTLVELLAVMAIMAILSFILIRSIAGAMSSQSVDESAKDFQDALETARTAAMAGNTFVWVGFFEESPSNLGKPGIGQVEITIVSSNDGTQFFSNSSLPPTLPAASLTQVKKLIRVPSVHLAVLTATQVPRTTIPAAPDQVGDPTFNTTTTLAYPLNGTQYSFTKIIQFNPQGDATRLGDDAVPVIEIGLQEARNAQVLTSSKNVVAVQVTGIGGHATIIRP